jgi:SOS-response transcriptional repressor LexA
LSVTLQLARDFIDEHPHAAELVHDIIKSYIEQHGIPPTFQDIADNVGLTSKSSIHRVLTDLEERGHIERLPARARAIRLK